MDKIIEEILKNGPAWALLLLLLWGISKIAQAIVTGIMAFGRLALDYLFNEKSGKFTEVLNWHTGTLSSVKEMADVVKQSSQTTTSVVQELREHMTSSMSEKNPVIKSLVDDMDRCCDILTNLVAGSCPTHELIIVVIQIICDIEKAIEIPEAIRLDHLTKLNKAKDLLNIKTPS